MAMVSQYFAEVGVGLDMKSLRSTQAYFKQIERTMLNFKRRVERQQTISFKAVVDRTSMMRSLQVSANRIAKTVVIPLTRFQVKPTSIARAINTAISSTHFSRQVSFGARLSGQSLSAMRAQIRSALEGTIIRPRINPIVTRGSARGVTSSGASSGRVANGGKFLDPRNTSRMSPWHNPMMVGGGMGAFLRYGAFSLPLVGGVMGLNAMSNTIREYRAQETGLSFAAGMTADPNKDVGYYKGYLHDVGERTGIRESLLSRDFHQMLAGSAGTEMEPHLEEGFMGLTQYASILGLNEENMRLVMRGVTQMIGKGKITAEEARRQVGEQIPTFMRILGEQAAGGDMAKLDKMFESGELVTSKYLPKVLAQMKRESDKMMGEYWSSLPYLVNNAARQQELFMRKFAESGAESGLNRFWVVWGQIVEDSIGSAEKLGRVFDNVAWKLTSALLVPQELIRWINGETDGRNFFQNWFGDASDHKPLTDLMSQVERFKVNMNNIEFGGLISIKSTLEDIEGILRLVNGLLEVLNGGMETYQAFKHGGVTGVINKELRDTDIEGAKKDLSMSPLKPGSPAYAEALQENLRLREEAREGSWVPAWLRWMDNSALSVYGDMWAASKSIGNAMVGGVEALGRGTMGVTGGKMWGRDDPGFTSINNYIPQRGESAYGVPTNSPASFVSPQSPQNVNSGNQLIIQNLTVTAQGQSDELPQLISSEIEKKLKNSWQDNLMFINTQTSNVPH